MPSDQTTPSMPQMLIAAWQAYVATVPMAWMLMRAGEEPYLPGTVLRAKPPFADTVGNKPVILWRWLDSAVKPDRALMVQAQLDLFNPAPCVIVAYVEPDNTIAFAAADPYLYEPLQT